MDDLWGHRRAHGAGVERGVGATAGAIGGSSVSESILFVPLAADPRWPKFTLGYMRYFGDSELTHVGTVDAGASIAIVQKNARRRGAWEVGIQGGVFSIFDFAAPSSGGSDSLWCLRVSGGATSHTRTIRRAPRADAPVSPSHLGAMPETIDVQIVTNLGIAEAKLLFVLGAQEWPDIR